MTKVGAALAVLASFSVLPNVSQARPEYPGRLQERVGMGDCVPVCTLCHTVPEGGADRLNAMSAPIWGIPLSEQPQPLPPTLDTLDSDGDMAFDGAELRAGTHPFVTGNTPICNPTYGCGARIAPLSPESAGRTAWLLLGGLGLVALARRIRRRDASE